MAQRISISCGLGHCAVVLRGLTHALWNAMRSPGRGVGAEHSKRAPGPFPTSFCLLALILVNSGKSHGDRQGQELAHTPTPSHPLCPLLAPRAGIAASWGLAGQGSPRGLFRLADFAKSLRFANSISHALSHPPSSSAWAAFALSAPRVARTLLGAFAGPTQGRTLYCPVTAVHLPTRRIYPLSVGSIRWIYPLDLSVGRQLPTGAASCHWHILSQQPAQLALRWSRLSTPRGGPAAASRAGSPGPAPPPASSARVR